MAGLKDFSVRLPAVAGRFYPGDAQGCRTAAISLLQAGARHPAHAPAQATRGYGGIVPHAGWICSGEVAGQTIAELARLNASNPPAVVVVFGAIHTPIPIEQAALDSHLTWQVPGRETFAATGLAQQLSGASKLFVTDDRFHQQEHAVEVELPLIQAAWPNAQILPIEVPLNDNAVQIGRETAQRVLAINRNCVFLASSDFTHYGPNYRFVPAGIGLHALAWAKDNDARLLRLITDFAQDRIVTEVRQRASACGGGAIAAMLAACKEAGATQVTLLRHTNSYETLAGKVQDDPTNAVGYAGVVVT